MSKLGEKERKELRRRAFELHLQDDQLIAVGHVAIRSAMLDKLIDLTFQQIIRHWPARFRRHRVRCFYGTGGESWKDEGLHASSSLRLCG